MHFVIFLLIFLSLDVALNILSKKTFKMLGIDFLFFSAWLGGWNYGILKGMIVGLVLLIEHGLFYPSRIQYILISFPSQMIASILGYFLGIPSFYTSLVAYQLLNTFIMAIFGGFGPNFAVFVLLNSLFNILTYRVFLFFR